MQIRKDKLVNDQYYHVFSRSIAKFVIFNNNKEYSRMVNIIKLYRHKNFNHKYSKFSKLDLITQDNILRSLEKNNLHLVEVVAYCIMPTHIHLILKQVQNKGISIYMSKILNCYSRFFNIKHERTGPLWSGRFKSVLITDDNQLLHLSRYVHLNPTSAGLIKKPRDWMFSSYSEYITEVNKKEVFCSFGKLLNMSPLQYKKFVDNQKSYQRELALIKNVLIDNYTG